MMYESLLKQHCFNTDVYKEDQDEKHVNVLKWYKIHFSSHSVILFSSKCSFFLRSEHTHYGNACDVSYF